jgi:RNA polymerase sigma-70 factor (ECF subfamily)
MVSDLNGSASIGEWVRAGQAGECDATEWIARRATRLALRTAAAILSNREEARDISQDVGVEVLRSLDRLRDPEAFDGWVHRITVRRAGRALASRRGRIHHEVALETLYETGEPDNGRPDLDGVLAARQELQRGLTKLPVKQQFALVLRYVHDLSDEDIAAALGCRPGTVHALLSRGRAALRGHIGQAPIGDVVAGGCQ